MPDLDEKNTIIHIAIMQLGSKLHYDAKKYSINFLKF